MLLAQSRSERRSMGHGSCRSTQPPTLRRGWSSFGALTIIVSVWAELKLFAASLLPRRSPAAGVARPAQHADSADSTSGHGYATSAYLRLSGSHGACLTVSYAAEGSVWELRNRRQCIGR